MDAAPAEAAQLKTHLAALSLGLVLASTPGCVVYRYAAVPDLRGSLAVPYKGVVRVSRTDASRINLRQSVEVVGDTLFGWWRPPDSDGLVRTGVPLRDVREVRVRRVNWPLTILADAALVMLGMKIVDNFHDGSSGPGDDICFLCGIEWE